jgi:ubiquinone/menaquinone biosynthesis C-methylase UbiE
MHYRHILLITTNRRENTLKTYIDFLATMGIDGAHPGGLQLTKDILCKLNIDRHSLILDVGCGTGQTAAYIYQHYLANVTAIDNHPLMIKKAKQRFATLKFPINLFHCSVESLPFADEQFDIVLCESVLSFVHLSKALKEIRRVLKNNGTLIAIEATKNDSLAQKDEKVLVTFYGFQNLLNEQEWKTYLNNSGFRVVDILLPSLYQKNAQQELLQYGTEMTIPVNISDEMLSILQKHEYLTIKYRNQLEYRVYFTKSKTK